MLPDLKKISDTDLWNLLNATISLRDAFDNQKAIGWKARQAEVVLINAEIKLRQTLVNRMRIASLSGGTGSGFGSLSGLISSSVGGLKQAINNPLINTVGAIVEKTTAVANKVLTGNNSGLSPVQQLEIGAAIGGAYLLTAQAAGAASATSGTTATAATGATGGATSGAAGSSIWGAASNAADAVYTTALSGAQQGAVVAAITGKSITGGAKSGAQAGAQQAIVGQGKQTLGAIEIPAGLQTAATQGKAMINATVGSSTLDVLAAGVNGYLGQLASNAIAKITPQQPTTQLAPLGGSTAGAQNQQGITKPADKTMLYIGGGLALLGLIALVVMRRAKA